MSEERTPTSPAARRPDDHGRDAPDDRSQNPDADAAAARADRDDRRDRSSGTDRPARRHRRWRWVLRTVIAVVVLLIVLAIAIQAVLWSDLPRSLVIAALQKALGVKVDAAQVETGWFGRTRVGDVTMTIPLDDGPFVQTPTIRVHHNNLIGIVLFGFRLDSLEIADPVLHLRQSPSGRWNVADFLGQMGVGRGSGGGGTDAAPDKPGRPAIPAIAIRNATVMVTDRTGKQTKVAPLSVVGKPGDAAPELVWQFEANLTPGVLATGQVATGGEWRHQVRLDIKDVRPLAGPFVGGDLPDLKLVARWDGRSAGGVRGRLAIERASVGGANLRGVANIEQGEGGRVVVRPDGLELLDGKGGSQAVAAGGEVRFEKGVLDIDQLVVRAAGAVVSLSGQFAPGTKSGDLFADWTATAAPSGTNHTGKLAARLTRTLDNRVEATADIDTRGHMTNAAGRGWDGKVRLSAAGPAFDDLSVTVALPAFTLTGPRTPLKLDGLAAQLAVSEKLGDRPGGAFQQQSPGLGVSLLSLRLRDTDQFAANGYYLPAAKNKNWGLQFTGKSLPLPKLSPDALGVQLDLAGGSDIIHVRKVQVATEETVFEAIGSYVFSRPKPLEVVVTLDHTPPETTAEARALGAKPTTPQLLQGLVSGRGEVAGTVKPMNLGLTGQLQGINAKLLGRDLGNVSVKVAGYADDHAAKLWSDPAGPPLSVLGGDWKLEAFHDLERDASTLTFGFTDLQLKELGDLLETPMAGTADGSWAVHCPTYKDVPHQVRAGGRLDVRNIRVGGQVIDSATAWTALENGRFSVAPLEVRRLNGTFVATAAVSVDDPREVEITDARLTDWPVVLPPSTYLTVRASAPRVVVWMPRAGEGDPNDPARGKPQVHSGPITAYTTVRVGDVDAGEARLNAQIEGRRLHVPLASADLFGSRLEAKATANLDDPNATSAFVSMRDVKPTELGKLAPGLRVLSGAFDMDVKLYPYDSPRAVEPMAFEATLASRDVYWRQAIGEQSTATSGVRVGDGRFRGFVRLDPSFGLDRMHLQDQPGSSAVAAGECPPRRFGPLPWNTLQVAGGEMSFWGRVVVNENDRGVEGLSTRSSHLRFGFRCLDLNEILQAFQPDGDPVPGLIDGNLILYGTNRQLRGAPVGSPARREAQRRQEAQRPRSARGGSADASTVAVPVGTQPATGPAGVAGAGPGGATTRAQPGPDDDTFLTRLLLSSQGDGLIQIRKSDLGNVRAISALYNFMRLGQDVRRPTGNGELTFRLENGDAFITAFRYFNRGVEVRAVGTVFDLYRLRRATVQSTVFGSIRTLKDIQLPILRSVVPDIDELLSALQQDGTSITVTGPLGKPDIKIVPFGELGESMRELLLGDYQASQQQMRRPPPAPR